jgi:DNA polymerase-1
MSDKLVLIDGHSILNRAFFGLPDLTNSEGLHTNAVYGFLNIMFKILEEEKPDYLVVAFDVHAPTFRHKMFDGYKGTRKPMADELREQVPLMKDMLHAMGVCVVEKEGYEADDVLGTLSVLGEKQGMEVRVLSGDRDLLQLATEHVQIRIPKTKKTGTEIENYFAADVKEHYQVSPKEFIDVKALMGDTADNIPGVPAIGEKTATALIAQYGSIEAVHEHAPEVKPPRASKNIVEFWDQAVMSKTLATIITDAPVEFEFSDAKIESVQALYTGEAYLLCKRLEFKNLLNRFQVDEPKNNAVEYFQHITTEKEAAAVWNKAKGKNIAFFFVEGVKDFAGLALAFGEQDIYFFETGENLSAGYLAARLGELSRINGCSREAGCSSIAGTGEPAGTSETTGTSETGKSSIDFGNVLITSDLKKALHYFDIMGEGTDSTKSCTPENFDIYLKIRGQYFDVMVAAYLLNPLKGEYPYEDIAKDYLDLMVPSKTDLLGKMSIAVAQEKEPDKLTEWACYEAYTAWKAYRVLLEKLKEKQMDKLFFDMEMPVVFVLSDMEKEGICMDAAALKEYGDKLSVSICELEQKIYAQAGETFNINSPKQLGVILFEKLQMPNGKKTKTGYSTSAEVLDKLANDYPIVADILEYRQLAKLKSTYADGLLNFVDDSGKIHTTFNQTITATGRLSSTDPNLQNIPIRIELGKLIRRVFHPMDGDFFVDSDYSQIELRVLAHMSGDPMLIEAFREGRDIHRTTASQVFHVPFDEVTALQRRNAKAVNFGIVYGISSFGLSQDLNISKKEAQEYIDSYFATYPSIKSFLDTTVENAKKDGYIRTMFGRIRPIPELSSSNFMQRQFGERVAMNSPIQGTAADIIKIAMIRVHDRLLREKRKSKLILQVHDELLVETAESEKDAIIAILEEEMRGAVSLDVEMEVGTECGKNWYDAH